MTLPDDVAKRLARDPQGNHVLMAEASPLPAAAAAAGSDKAGTEPSAARCAARVEEHRRAAEQGLGALRHPQAGAAHHAVQVRAAQPTKQGGNMAPSG